MAFRTKLLIYFLLFGFGLSVFSFSSADIDHILISQVQITGGSGKTTNDFIEIYNPTRADIDLKGMRLVKRTKTGTTDTLIKSWTSSVIIKAHGFYLWANSDFTDISISADVTTTLSIADDNGVAIRNGPNDTGTIVDSVAWGLAANAFIEGAVFPSNPTANQSLERNPGGDSGNGIDTDNNASDFFSQANTHPRNSQSQLIPPLLDPTPNPTPSNTPTPSITLTPTPQPEASPSPTETPTPSPTETLTPTPSPTATPTPSDTPVEYIFPIYSPTPSPTPIAYISISSTPKPLPSLSPTNLPSASPTLVATPVVILKPTPNPLMAVIALPKKIISQATPFPAINVSPPVSSQTAPHTNRIKIAFVYVWHLFTHYLNMVGIQ